MTIWINTNETLVTEMEPNATPTGQIDIIMGEVWTEYTVTEYTR